MAQVLNASADRIEDIDARVARAHPHSTASIDEHIADAIARQRVGVAGVVAINREGIRAAMPASQAAVFHRDPKILPGILDDVPDEITRQRIGGVMPSGISGQTPAVIAHQPIFSAEPDKPLRVLQGSHDRALRQSLGGGEMFENERRSVGRDGDRLSQHPTNDDDQRRASRACLFSCAHRHNMPEIVEHYR
jgi:hypothetical protein